MIEKEVLVFWEERGVYEIALWESGSVNGCGKRGLIAGEHCFPLTVTGHEFKVSRIVGLMFSRHVQLSWHRR